MNLLSIAGSDCSGGAGIQADIKTFSALGGYGMSVITSVVAENTFEVIGKLDVSGKMIEKQIRAVMEDITVDAIKIGMLPSEDAIIAVSDSLKDYEGIIIADPVMISSSGKELIDITSMGTYVNKILPLVTLITPNIDEAESFTGIMVNTIEDMKKAAVRLNEMGAINVLVKGGHLNEDAVDILYDGKQFYSFTAKRLNNTTTHGTGCTLSSAITAYAAGGYEMKEAVKMAKEYVRCAIEKGFDIGKGPGPTNHFHSCIMQKTIK